MKLLIWLPVFLWCLLDHGVSDVDTDEVSVMEGDSVTLNTGVQTNQQDRIKWYYNNIRIAQITGDQSKICTDVQCNEGTERFRDRLKLDHQTGSLTITHTRYTDSGEYTLKISSGSSSDSEKIFSVSVTGVSGVDTEVSVMEGDSVTLNTGVQTNQHDRIRWYYNDIRIAQITGDQSKICTDVQCNEDTERFRDRLKLDHQTGSLTIMNTRNTHSGEYTLRIISSRFGIMKIFSVSVTAVPDSGPSSAAIGLICAVILIVAAAAAAGICCIQRSKQKGNRRRRDDHDQDNGAIDEVALELQTKAPQMDDDDNGTSHNETGNPLMANANGTSPSDSD